MCAYVLLSHVRISSSEYAILNSGSYSLSLSLTPLFLLTHFLSFSRCFLSLSPFAQHRRCFPICFPPHFHLPNELPAVREISRTNYFYGTLAGPYLRVIHYRFRHRRAVYITFEASPALLSPFLSPVLSPRSVTLLLFQRKFRRAPASF